MDHPLKKEDETLEDLQNGGFQLLQKKTGFRFGMDSVLLADFVNIHPRDYVADFGTGSCVLPLLLMIRNKGASFSCIEIQEEIADMARRTVIINHLEDKIQIVAGNAENAENWIQPCSMDAVICNPPYGIPGTCITSPFSSRAVSRSQQTDSLS